MFDADIRKIWKIAIHVTKKLLLENIIACNTIVVELFGVIPNGETECQKEVLMNEELWFQEWQWYFEK